MNVNNLYVRTVAPVPTSMGRTRVSVRQAGQDPTVKQVVSIYYKICRIIFFEVDHIFLKIECLFLLFATIFYAHR